MLLENYTAVKTALQAANLPLQPVFDSAKWFTQKAEDRSDAKGLPTAAPLVTVIPGTLNTRRISDGRDYQPWGVVAIVVRARCNSEERGDELIDFVEECVKAAWTSKAHTEWPLDNVNVVTPVDHVNLLESFVWRSVIHCVFGIPPGGSPSNA